jgi:hypothetical protein
MWWHAFSFVLFSIHEKYGKTFVNNRKGVQKFNPPNVYVPMFNIIPPLLGNIPNLK